MKEMPIILKWVKIVKVQPFIGLTNWLEIKHTSFQDENVFSSGVGSF